MDSHNSTQPNPRWVFDGIACRSYEDVFTAVASKKPELKDSFQEMFPTRHDLMTYDFAAHRSFDHQKELALGEVAWYSREGAWLLFALEEWKETGAHSAEYAVSSSDTQTLIYRRRTAKILLLKPEQLCEMDFRSSISTPTLSCRSSPAVLSST